MSVELLEQLAQKINKAVETIQLQQIEIEELKEKQGHAQYEVDQAKQECENLRRENESLQQELQSWRDKLSSLIGQFDNI